MERTATTARMDDLAKSARVLIQGRTKVHSRRLHELDPFPIQDVLPARRIGSYPGARNRINFHPHARGSEPIMLPCESREELGWLESFEFDPDFGEMLTQPFVIVWPVGSKCIWRVPDILVRHRDGWLVVDVKPDDPVIRTPHVERMFRLTRLTLSRAGWRTMVAGSLSRQAIANLRSISYRRAEDETLLPHVERVREARPATLGGVLDLVGDDDLGAAVALHLLAHGVTTDLDRPLLLGSRLTWP